MSLLKGIDHSLMPRFLSRWFSQLAGMFAIASAREHSDAAFLEIDRDSVSFSV
jgi:hypothetical protein